MPWRLFGNGKNKGPTPPNPPVSFPPTPAWKPSFVQSLDQVAERIRHYSNQARDFAVFQYGTCVILDDGASDLEAKAFALDALSKVYMAHPDMTPSPMKDGNLLVQYGQPVVNVVLASTVADHRAEIEEHHLDGVTPHEVLMTPLGPNKFDELGKAALLGRCWMFMDAQAPTVVRIERKPA